MKQPNPDSVKRVSEIATAAEIDAYGLTEDTPAVAKLAIELHVALGGLVDIVRELQERVVRLERRKLP